MASSRLGRRRVAAGVAALALLAVLVRFWALGYRVFHWDEGRVGYWILRYAETGQYTYQPIIHGPFLYHVDKYVFAAFGANDFTARAVVALVGGLLPLSAWLFRDHLRDTEVLAFAGFLTLNPVLLYYSRFMRNDVLVGAFSLFALGFFVRARASDRNWYWPVGVLFLALAFTTKANALVYIVCWLGAGLLVVDHRLLGGGDGWVARARERALEYAGATVDWIDGLLDPERRDGGLGTHALSGFDALANGPLGRYLPPFVALFVEFLVVFAFFFSPRPGLAHTFTSFSGFEAATAGAFHEMVSLWGGGHAHSYVEFLKLALETHVEVALPLTAFAVGGFVYDRYWLGRRDFVEFCAYWGVFSVVGYPIITDIAAHWSIVHAMIPLAVPAAVGVGWIADRGLSFLRSGDRIGAAVAVVVLLCVAGFAGATAYDTSFASPQDDANPLVQYGQPAGHMQGTLADVDTAIQGNDGTDVLFYGDHFYSSFGPSNSMSGDFREPQHWTWRMPLPWYLERYGAEVDSTLDIGNVTEAQPPVVIALAKHYDEIDPKLSGYTSVTYRITSSDTPTVIWIRNDTHESA